MPTKTEKTLFLFGHSERDPVTRYHNRLPHYGEMTKLLGKTVQKLCARLHPFIGDPHETSAAAQRSLRTRTH